MVRFRIERPGVYSAQLRMLDSYWMQPLPATEKVRRFATTYMEGLDPKYWFDPESPDLDRHRMKGFSRLPRSLSFFLVAGIAYCIVKFRSSPHRTVLIALAATPFSAALVEVGVTRLLVMVVPVTLLACLGLDLTHRWTRRWLGYAPATLLLASWLSLASVGMLSAALLEGPTWYRDYGLFGMQWGAAQLFDEIPDHLARTGAKELLMSSSWANNTDVFVRFFMPGEDRVRIGGGHGLIEHRQTIGDETAIVLTPSEFTAIRDSGKFEQVRVDRLIRYPDGRPGFYFVRLRYRPDVDRIFAREREEARRPVTEERTIDGEPVRITHPPLDMGPLEFLTDRRNETLVRVAEANPAIFDFEFSRPRLVTALGLDFGTHDLRLTISLFPPGPDTAPVVYAREYRRVPTDPHFDIAFTDGPPEVARLRLEILSLNDGESAKIHVRDVEFRGPGRSVANPE
jgi:hypothetical protein